MICPPDYAYGNKAMGDSIPPNSVLLFSIEVVDVEQGVKKEEKPKAKDPRAPKIVDPNTDFSKFQVIVTK